MKSRGTLRSALRFIESMGASRMKFGLRRMRSAMEALGNPQDQYPSIHIAGTNGKGSVTAMMASVLKETGLKVGMYTSPHLERLEERFQINGRPIPSNDLARLTHQLISKNIPALLTQFEFLTAIAFLWFKESHVDVAVIETGLGGRLDATNVIKKKLLSIITTIGLDHTAWLGSSVESIAFEKAGIIKHRVPVVTGAGGAALRVIKKVAREKAASLFYVKPSDWKVLSLPPLPLKGRHQKRNAAIVVRAIPFLRASGLAIHETSLRNGLRNVRWPGRFEILKINSGGRKTSVVLDGAHNPQAVRVLVRTLQEERIKKVRLLFGVLRDKDAATMASILSPFVDQCVTVTIESDRALPAFFLAALPAWKNRSKPASRLSEAWEWLNDKENGSPILVTGSLYLVGAVRKFLREHNGGRP